jgi:hypothetical protein
MMDEDGSAREGYRFIQVAGTLITTTPTILHPPLVLILKPSVVIITMEY